jgi:hypothetical protein
VTRRASRTTAAALLLTALTTAASACGIRATDVPVDAGPAPARATCDAPQSDAVTEVYLVCGSRVRPVRRPVDLPADGAERVTVAETLLDQLQTDPGRDELTAGFRSVVPPDLTVSGPVGEDPAVVLRLSERPSDLTWFALVQIVCTFAADDRLGDGDTVVLGGPADAPLGQPKTYTCDPQTRATPQTAPLAGDPRPLTR